MMFENSEMSNHDWKLVCERLQAKLNAIASELDAFEKNSVSADCSFLARSLREKFGLELNGNYVKPEWLELERKLDAVEALSLSLCFAPFSGRRVITEELLNRLSDFSFAFHVFGPFIAGEKVVR